MTSFTDAPAPAVGSPEFQELVTQTRARIADFGREGPAFAAQVSAEEQRLRELLSSADAALPSHVDGSYFHWLVRDARDEEATLRRHLPGSKAAEAAAARVSMLVSHFGGNTRI